MSDELSSRFLALIPARGGSKRLPRKNVLPLAGRPLIAWSIEAAREAQNIDHVIVSTDDAGIADTARRHGAGVLDRPAALATDQAGTLDVILHALRTLDETFEHVVVLQPTSPLRSAADIDNAIQLQLERRADAVVSVCEADHPPEWCNTLPDDRSMAGFFRPGVRGTRSQDLPVSYRLNGAIYVYRVERLLAQENLEMDDNSYAYVMPRERSVDIDTAMDFDIAELFMRRHGAGETGA